MPGRTREEARAGLRPGNFQGRPPRGRRSNEAERASTEAMNHHWFGTSRFKRRARVTSVEALTSTGTVRLGFQVADGEPFEFLPGQFVGIEAHFEGRSYLVGNGAMLEEMAMALSDLGVVQPQIYKEPFFDPIHQPDRDVVARIRERFVATDLFSSYAARRGSQFDLDRDLEAARTGKAGNGDRWPCRTSSNCCRRSSPTTRTRRTPSRLTSSAPGTVRTDPQRSDGDLERPVALPGPLAPTGRE